MLNVQGKTRFLIATILIVALSISTVFNNCSNDATTFSSLGDSLTSSPNSVVTGGSGEGYLGKPGEYVRTFPGYQCENEVTGYMGTMTLASSFTISKDLCNVKNIIFSSDSLIVERAIYNPDYVGIGEAIYEYKATNSSELPVTEVWCRHESTSEGIDIAVKVANNISQSQGKIYLGKKQSGNWQSQVVPSISVSRSSSSSKLIYTGNGVRLEVPRTSDPQIVVGNLSAIVDNVNYSLEVSCRVAADNPIEDMNTGLTQQYSLTDKFSTQEGVCAEDSVVMCENWESRTANQSVSATALPGSPAIKLPVWSFGQSYAQTAPTSYTDSVSIQFPHPVGEFSAGVADFAFPNLSDVYVRFYMKFSGNFAMSPIRTDLALIWGTANASVHFGLNPSGTPILRTAGGLQSGLVRTSALGPIAYQDNLWKCVEIHLRSNSIGNSSGTMDLWIDDQLAISQNGVDLPNPFYDFEHYLNWHCIGGADANNKCIDAANPLNQHQAQSFHFDNHVVAKQRIGCLN